MASAIRPAPPLIPGHPGRAYPRRISRAPATGPSPPLARAPAARAGALSRGELNPPLWPFVAAVFLGPALIFTLEPMVGKQVLPRLGGVPAVWNTCLLFFQAMLLAGYAYTHYGLRKLGMKWHTLLHHV